jgi:hypothetical protein
MLNLAQGLGIHIVRLWSDYRLMTEFIRLVDTARDYTLQFIITYTHTHTLTSTVTSLLPLLGSGVQRQTFLFLWVVEMFPTSATSS